MSFFSKQIDKRIAAYQRELIETHYREVENMYRQIRGWRHDYRNHIQMMKVLAASGDMDALKVYLDELDTDLNTVDTVVKTGNPMADAILNSKISLARSRNIPTQVDACELKLEHVSFRYPGAEEDTIHDLDLTVRPGEKLAIVGLNGAGKTTLVKLLCGLFDPTEGRVLLNGVNVRDFNRREYYGLFSAVFQEFSILDVTVAENIAQTNENIDTQKLWDCIEKAGLTQTIQKLPKGLDTHVGREVYLDGVLFSGGQTQRLMLARALYKDGAILLLDEPTAALDPLAENDIYQKYKDMTAGKTSLFISHRLASTRFCDRIIFIADGRITEEGTHDQLLARGGAYARLFEIQSRYYQEGKAF